MLKTLKIRSRRERGAAESSGGRAGQQSSRVPQQQAGPWHQPSRLQSPESLFGHRGHLFQEVANTSGVTEENRVEKGAGNGAAGSILWGLCEEDGAGKCIRTPQNPRAHPGEQLSARLRLTVERARRDQLSRDKEGAQLLHQLPVGKAAPPPKGVPVQRGDALGHEEAPVGCIAGEEGSLEVDGPCTSPRADVLHGCWGKAPQSLPRPQSIPPPAGTAPHPKLTPPQNFPCGQTELLREENASSHGKKNLTAWGARADRAGGGHAAFCRQWKRCPRFAPRWLEPPRPAFPAPFPPCPGDTFQPEQKP